MSFGGALYQLFIYPLQLIYEFIFYYAASFAGSIGVAIILLSLAMNFMLLPLYRQADRIQDEERDAQKKMDHWLRHIKATFKGNERFMMTQTYYRQNNYKPYYALRGMMPLLLEIPFFIAAYNYLSDLYALKTSFGPIQDLSAPDGMITVFGLTINVLPVIMTLINIISGAIYTKGLKFKDKLQLYGMAVIFLVLLYNSPSGLVLYWTMNNLFSLVKNIIIRTKKPVLAGLLTVSALGVLALIWGLVMPKEDFSEGVPMMYIALICQIPLLIMVMKKHTSFRLPSFGKKEPRPLLFFSGCLFMTLLTGALIPSAVVSDSPMEFVTLTDYHNPLINVLYSFLLAAGIFIVWLGILYYLSGKKLRVVLEVLIWVIFGAAIINYMLFNKESSSLTAELKYSFSIYFDPLDWLINIAVIIAAVAVLFFIWKKSRKFVGLAYLAFCLTLVGMTGVNVVRIQAAVPEIKEVISNSGVSKEEGVGKIIDLSKTGKNVVVIMADRAINSYIPYLFAEKPELKKQFDGFTYYPNTLSFGGATIFGCPALFGGYDYTPAEINARDQVSLEDKHNESILMMPRIFSQNDYDVTVINPAYAGYSWVPDLSIFDPYPGIEAYNIEQGQMVTDEYLGVSEPRINIWKRNIFCYGLMRSVPYVLRSSIYMDGSYYKSSMLGLSKNTMYFQFGVTENTMNTYAALDGLPGITQCSNKEKGTLLMLTTNLTHSDNTLLQEPDYSLSQIVSNEEYEKAHQDRFTLDGVTMHVDDFTQMSHYHVNMAAMMKLGNWFDYLRKNGVYDNTRIIIVSDHGRGLNQFDYMMLNGEVALDIMGLNPVLLVKDFGSKGFTTDNSFMTNGDVPTIATNDIIKDPVNPFTGNPVNSDRKNGKQYIILSQIWQPEKQIHNTFMESDWISVHDDIFKAENWQKEGRH